MEQSQSTRGQGERSHVVLTLLPGCPQYSPGLGGSQLIEATYSLSLAESNVPVVFRVAATEIIFGENI